MFWVVSIKYPVQDQCPRSCSIERRFCNLDLLSIERRLIKNGEFFFFPNMFILSQLMISIIVTLIREHIWRPIKYDFQEVVETIYIYIYIYKERTWTSNYQRLSIEANREDILMCCCLIVDQGWSCRVILR